MTEPLPSRDGSGAPSGPVTVPGPATGRLPSLGPPWLWLYLVLAVSRVIPKLVSTWREDWSAYVTAEEQVPGIGALRILMVAEAIPALFLVAGVIFVAFPQLRRWQVERGHHAQGVDRIPDPLTAVQAFVDQYASGVEVRLTASAGSYARIYPVSWRRARIMLYDSFLGLWRDHRPEAEALLLHEIAHRRQGEHLIVGLGSPFAWLVRVWGAVFIVLSVFPVIVLAATYRSLTDDVTTQWLYESTAGSVIAQLVFDSTQPLAVLLFPVAAFWLAELTADRWAAKIRGVDAVLGALAAAPRPSIWRRLLLPPLDHPPIRLRRALLTSGRTSALAVASWPATVLVAFVVAAVTAVPQSLLLDWRLSQQPQIIACGAGVALDSARTVAIASLLILLVWPAVATRWPRLWAPVGRSTSPTVDHAPAPDRASVARAAARPYLAASIVPLGLLLGALIPTPGMPPASLPSAPPTPKRVYPLPTPIPPIPSSPTASDSASATSSSPSGSPGLTGSYRIFWSPPGDTGHVHEAEIQLSGTGGVVQIRC